MYHRLTLNPQPSTLNPQPSTLNPQPSTLNPSQSASGRDGDGKPLAWVEWVFKRFGCYSGEEWPVCSQSQEKEANVILP
jgi:hypothetical protein